MSSIHLGPRLYDGILGLLLKGMRRRVRDLIERYHLYPFLDICCGTGDQCRMLRPDKHPVIGLDLDKSMLAYGRSRKVQVPLICADAVRIPFKDNVFSGILLSYALHEKKQADRLSILDETRRLLNQAGKIILVDFAPAWSLKSRIGSGLVYGVERMADRDHFRYGREFIRQGGVEKLSSDWKIDIHEKEMLDLSQTEILLGSFD